MYLTSLRSDIFLFRSQRCGTDSLARAAATRARVVTNDQFPTPERKTVVRDSRSGPTMKFPNLVLGKESSTGADLASSPGSQITALPEKQVVVFPWADQHLQLWLNNTR